MQRRRYGRGSNVLYAADAYIDVVAPSRRSQYALVGVLEVIIESETTRGENYTTKWYCILPSIYCVCQGSANHSEVEKYSLSSIEADDGW